MDMDGQLVIVAVAAGAATVYAVRGALRQFQRPDDEPADCHGCPANRIEPARMKRTGDVR